MYSINRTSYHLFNRTQNHRGTSINLEINRRYQIQCERHVSRICFLKIGKPNNKKKSFRARTPKGSAQNEQARLKSPMPDGGEP